MPARPWCWLAAQPQVDVRRIGVLGWSNGATTADLPEQRRAHPAAGEPPIAGAALFYPGCGPLRERQAVLESVPLLMQLGARRLDARAALCGLCAPVAGAAGSDVTVHVYEGSYHGFEGQALVRLRTDVPNGSSAQGVHQGGNPEARTKLLAALDAFLSRVLATRAAP